ncbi:hypothetical protein BDW72DRAFT_102465 [Aspergillus terricola var. indicus]
MVQTFVGAASQRCTSRIHSSVTCENRRGRGKRDPPVCLSRLESTLNFESRVPTASWERKQTLSFVGTGCNASSANKRPPETAVVVLRTGGTTTSTAALLLRLTGDSDLNIDGVEVRTTGGRHTKDPSHHYGEVILCPNIRSSAGMVRYNLHM